jgi:hypothetical protein
MCARRRAMRNPVLHCCVGRAAKSGCGRVDRRLLSDLSPLPREGGGEDAARRCGEPVRLASWPHYTTTRPACQKVRPAVSGPRWAKSTQQSDPAGSALRRNLPGAAFSALRGSNPARDPGLLTRSAPNPRCVAGSMFPRYAPPSGPPASVLLAAEGPLARAQGPGPCGGWTASTQCKTRPHSAHGALRERVNLSLLARPCGLGPWLWIEPHPAPSIPLALIS